jgi:flagellar biosynthetic protein FlhB
VIWFVLKPMVYGIEHYAGLPMAQVMAEAQDLTVRMLIRVTGVLTLIAGADYLYQRFSYFKSLRMTKQEVKEEFKQSEGDPTIKGKQRQIRFQRARRRIAAMVPKADVVVTNPTHFAVAMQYDPKAMQAPKVVAKGADVLAHRIREIAREHDIPIVENPPLARALYAAVEEDQEIPSEHYRAVAEVISYVFKLKGKRLGG